MQEVISIFWPQAVHRNDFVTREVVSRLLRNSDESDLLDARQAAEDNDLPIHSTV